MQINKKKNQSNDDGWRHPERVDIKIDGETIEQVKNFKYLGTIINENITQEAEINSRLETVCVLCDEYKIHKQKVDNEKN